jgi:transposase-like protein
MEDHIRELLERYQYSEEVKEIAAFRVLFGGEEPKQVMQELAIHSIHTLNHWVAAYRKKIDQGLISLPPMTAKQKQNLEALQQRTASPELALLEQLLHLPELPFEDLPKLFLITLALPDPPERLTSLPAGWREEAGYEVCHRLLANWLKDPHVLATGVPSAVVPESTNYLIHPQHPAYAQIKILHTAPFEIDPRLWRKQLPG